MITATGGSILINDETYVGLYECTVTASPSDSPTIIDAGFKFPLTVNCAETLTAPSPITVTKSHVIGTVLTINFGTYTKLYDSCLQNLVDKQITYRALPLENGV